MGKRRRFAVKPVDPLEFEFADGTIKRAIFTVDAFILMSDEFGDIATLAEDEQRKPYDLAAKILYCGMKVLDTETTMEEAEAIVLSGGLGVISAVFESVIETYNGMDLSEDIKKKVELQITRLMK